MFDADGNLWSGQNWMPGSQSGLIRSIGGGVVKITPNGAPLSPPITGFTGMGIDGVGWGTAVTRDKVWITSFNGKILVLDFDGHPIGSESDFPFKEKLTGLMGIGVAANGDVWIADGSDNQLLQFPGGRVKDGRIIKVAGLKSPFDIVIDQRSASGSVIPSPIRSFDFRLMIRPRWNPSARGSASELSPLIRRATSGLQATCVWTSRCRKCLTELRSWSSSEFWGQQGSAIQNPPA